MIKGGKLSFIYKREANLILKDFFIRKSVLKRIKREGDKMGVLIWECWLFKDRGKGRFNLGVQANFKPIFLVQVFQLNVQLEA